MLTRVKDWFRLHFYTNDYEDFIPVNQHSLHAEVYKGDRWRPLKQHGDRMVPMTDEEALESDKAIGTTLLLQELLQTPPMGYTVACAVNNQPAEVSNDQSTSTQAN